MSRFTPAQDTNKRPNGIENYFDARICPNSKGPPGTKKRPGARDRNRSPEHPAGIDLSAAQQRARHDNTLNLVGALVNLGDLRVPHHPLTGKSVV